MNRSYLQKSLLLILFPILCISCQITKEEADRSLMNGAKLFVKEDYDEAMVYLTEAVKHPDCSVAYFYIGKIYEKKGDFDKALENYSRAIESDATNAALYSILAEFYEKRGNLDKAIENYSKAIELDPKDGINYFDRAKIFWDKKEYQKSIQDFEKFMEFCPFEEPKKSEVRKKVNNIIKAIRIDAKHNGKDL